LVLRNFVCLGELNAREVYTTIACGVYTAIMCLCLFKMRYVQIVV